jgi:hypothetical protein
MRAYRQQASIRLRTGGQPVNRGCGFGQHDAAQDTVPAMIPPQPARSSVVSFCRRMQASTQADTDYISGHCPSFGNRRAAPSNVNLSFFFRYRSLPIRGTATSASR